MGIIRSFVRDRKARPASHLGAMVAAGAVVALVLGPALTASAVPGGKAASKPGLTGPAITVTRAVSFDGDNRAYDLAADKAGNAYLAWISSAADSSTPRQIHLCTLPPGATGCKGGVKTIDTPQSQSAAGLRLLVTPAGAVTVVWYIDSAGGGSIMEATSQSGVALSAARAVASGPAEGSLLDAEFGPGDQIWTVVYPGLPATTLDVRPGITQPAVAVRVPYSIGFASLAFAGSTPILAITEAGRITQPAAFASRPGAAWTAFKNVGGTWTVGTNLGLTTTASGVRLTTGVGNADYSPVVAAWNGNGFSRPTLTGDRNNCAPNSHDTGTDASGRLVDVTNECGNITVSNLADTLHAAIIRFGAPTSATLAGGAPQIASTPRGQAWVAWSIETGAPTFGDTLKVVPLLLPGLQQKVTRHASHGSVTVTGPASCLPADTIPVAVTGHGDAPWSVTHSTLKLGGATVRSSINGAALTAGRTYALNGTVTLTNGGSHQTVTATVKFRSCPNP